MKLTIIPSEKAIIKDGVGYDSIEQDLSWIPANVYAVQWDGSKGEIEYTDKDNEAITELGIYAQASTDFDNEKIRIEEAAKAAEDALPYEALFREVRNSQLKDCDWTVTVDSPLTNAKQTEWKTYRQALRDLPSNKTGTWRELYSDRSHSDWPTQPT